MDVLTDPDMLLDRAAELIAAGRAEAAWPVLQAAAEPRTARWSELSGLLHLRAGQLERARVILDEAIIEHAGHGGLRRLRADVLQRLGELTAALGDAAEAVILDRADATAKALLGALLLQAGQVDDAIACLGEAVVDMPARPSFRRGLAAALEAAGLVDEAAEALRAGIAAMPADLALRNEAVLLAVRRQAFEQANALAEAARADGVVDACLFGLKGHALSSLGRHAEAAEAYQEALKLGPDDPYVRHLVAASGLLPGAARAPEEYVRAVFDGYASRFEAHLLGLGYRVPGLLRAGLLRHLPGTGALPRMLDLGCGTGLMGVVFSDLASDGLVGVDLSPGMLAEARVKGLYSALHEADILTFLRGATEQYGAILAADVLCYFGDLSEVLTGISLRLAPGGLLLASLEELTGAEGQGWRLGRQGRYAHDAGWVRARVEAAGLVVRELAREKLRQEAGGDVAGLVLVAERAA